MTAIRYYKKKWVGYRPTSREYLCGRICRVNSLLTGNTEVNTNHCLIFIAIYSNALYRRIARVYVCNAGVGIYTVKGTVNC